MNHKYLSNVKNIFKGYLGLFKYLFFSRTIEIFKVNISTGTMIIFLGLTGISRNILEVILGGKWARAWFSLSPDVLFTMFFYPIFLCFFSTTLLHFFSNKLGLKVKIKEILSVLLLLQIMHLFIPLFDGIADLYNIPYRIYFSGPLYQKLIFSPLAFTPLILLFTWPTSLGIDITWFFVSFILLKLYLKHFKFPVFESLLALSISFYIVYMSIYPVYFFFINETVIGSNYMFGLFFMFMSLPSVMYVKMQLERER